MGDYISTQPDNLMKTICLTPNKVTSHSTKPKGVRLSTNMYVDGGYGGE